MSSLNSAPPAPLVNVPVRSLKTKLLNFFLGNPVRALFTCALFWAVLGMLIWHINHG